MLAAGPDPVPGLLEESHLFNQTLAIEDTRARMRRFMEVGGQTREGELNLDALLEKL